MRKLCSIVASILLPFAVLASGGSGILGLRLDSNANGNQNTITNLSNSSDPSAAATVFQLNTISNATASAYPIAIAASNSAAQAQVTANIALTNYQGSLIAATNGLVNQNVTNGLASTQYVNNAVSSGLNLAVTNHSLSGWITVDQAGMGDVTNLALAQAWVSAKHVSDPSNWYGIKINAGYYYENLTIGSRTYVFGDTVGPSRARIHGQLIVSGADAGVSVENIYVYGQSTSAVLFTNCNGSAGSQFWSCQFVNPTTVVGTNYIIEVANCNGSQVEFHGCYLYARNSSGSASAHNTMFWSHGNSSVYIQCFDSHLKESCVNPNSSTLCWLDSGTGLEIYGCSWITLHNNNPSIYLDGTASFQWQGNFYNPDYKNTMPIISGTGATNFGTSPLWGSGSQLTGVNAVFATNSTYASIITGGQSNTINTALQPPATNGLATIQYVDNAVAGISGGSTSTSIVQSIVNSMASTGVYYKATIATTVIGSQSNIIANAYPSSNPSNFVTQVITNGLVAQTSLTTQLGNYYLNSNPSNFIDKTVTNGLASVNYVISATNGAFNNDTNWVIGQAYVTKSITNGLVGSSALASYYLNNNPSNFVNQEVTNGLASIAFVTNKIALATNGLSSGSGGSSSFATNATYAVTVTGSQSNTISTALQPSSTNVLASTNYVNSALGSYYLNSNPSNYVTQAITNGLVGSSALSSYYLNNNPSNYVGQTVTNGLVSANNTITINGSTQTLGSNPSFTTSGGGGGGGGISNVVVNGNVGVLSGSGSNIISTVIVPIVSFATNCTYAVTITGGQSNTISTALQPAATNGLVTQTITNGLVSQVNLTTQLGSYYLNSNPNNFVDKTITNGLVGQSITNGLASQTSLSQQLSSVALSDTNYANSVISGYSNYVYGLSYVTQTITNGLVSQVNLNSQLGSATTADSNYVNSATNAIFIASTNAAFIAATNWDVLADLQYATTNMVATNSLMIQGIRQAYTATTNTLNYIYASPTNGTSGVLVNYTASGNVVVSGDPAMAATYIASELSFRLYLFGPSAISFGAGNYTNAGFNAYSTLVTNLILFVKPPNSTNYTVGNVYVR